MNGLRIGSLFSGTGGLTLAVQEVLGGTVAWHSDIEDAPSRVLAAHWPGVPNLGDITAVNWADVEPVDVIEGGSPCQDLSVAGRQAGMRAGTRSGLWASMRDAIATIRPRLVVWENVRGALSAHAASDLESCPWCLGGAGDGEPSLRALGRVLGDLADAGFDAEWTCLRASDVGAPHGRPRVFVVAWPSDTDGIGPIRGRESWGRRAGLADRRFSAAADTSGNGRHEGRPEPARLIRRPDAAIGGTTPADAGRDGRERGTELDERTPVRLAAPSGDDTARRVLDWGPYGPAIGRWESVLGRPAPSPTEPGRNGQPRLSPRFVEFLMGLPDGWVTDVPDISRNSQLKMLGNGVVPAQAVAAVRHLLALAPARLHEGVPA